MIDSKETKSLCFSTLDTPMKQRRIKGKWFEVAVIYADRLTFDAHSHDEYVLSCNISGNETLTLDGRAMTAEQSATTLYNPGQVQAGDGTDCIVSMYLDPFFFEKEMLSTREVNFGTPVVCDAALHRQFCDLIGMVFGDVPEAVAEEAVFRILDGTTRRYSELPRISEPRSHDWRVERVKEMLLTRLDGTPRLEALAGEVGLNKLALLRMFTKAVGVPPITWHRAKRIEAARRLLKSGTSAAETAYLTGFSDQAHLTRWFGRAYGISPVRFASS